MRYSLDEAERLAYVYPTQANLEAYLAAQADYLQELTEEDYQGQAEDAQRAADEAERRADDLEEELQNMRSLRMEAAGTLEALGVLPDLVAKLREA